MGPALERYSIRRECELGGSVPHIGGAQGDAIVGQMQKRGIAECLKTVRKYTLNLVSD
jgi:hypothetical protein